MHYDLKISHWSGRLCNNITQLANAIHVARHTQSRLQMPENIRGLRIREFDYSNGEQCTEIEPALFFNLRDELTQIPSNELPSALTWNQRRDLLASEIRTLLPGDFFPTTPPAPAELVIYIRSGDVFHHAGRIKGKHPWVPDFALWAIRMITKKGNPVNPFFVQPPASFYKRVIGSRNWQSIRIIAEDTANPVIPELLRTHPEIQFEPSDLASDIKAVLNACHLAIGYGTFGITLALLNQELQTLFTPEMTELQLGNIGPDDIDGVRIHPFKFRNYIRHGDWKLSAAQKQLMLTHADADLIECTQDSTESAAISR